MGAKRILMLMEEAILTYRPERPEAILIHPERLAELLRELSEQCWYNTDTSETMIYIAMTHLMVRRLA